jgi:ribosomal protein S25
LKAELSEIREKSTIMGGRYKHNQLLEDLRHLQESLAQEKKSWSQEKELMEQDMETKKRELAKYQVAIHYIILLENSQLNGIFETILNLKMITIHCLWVLCVIYISISLHTVSLLV